MIHFIVLMIATLTIIFLALAIYIKTKDVSLIVGLFFIYFFSLLGGVIIVLDKINGDISENIGMDYYYLFYKMYDIYLDTDYLLAIVIYAVFIIVIELTLLLFVMKQNSTKHKIDPFIISHYKLMLLCFLFFLGSLSITGKYIIDAVNSNMAAYTLIRYSDEPIPFYSIHQILIRMAIFPFAIGFAIFLCGSNSEYITTKQNKLCLLLYILIFLIFLAYLYVLGNRSELLIAIITGFLFYVKNNAKISWKKIILSGFSSLCILGSIASMRGTSLMDMGSVLETSVIVNGFMNAITSNEMIAAHMSMYGVLSYNIPFTYGYSFVSLIASIVPSLFWHNRPPDIYWHYFNNIPAVPGQGYVIHHATGWYLNFGIIGVVIGAILIGIFWSKCYNSTNYISRFKGYYSNIFRILSSCLFVGALLPLLRGGLEGYKALIIEHFLIPIIIIGLVCAKNNYRKNTKNIFYEN
jgi:oligosaccharide repeat unit polymerase